MQPEFTRKLRTSKSNSFFFFCMLLFGTRLCFAQQQKTDSLRLAISFEKDDSTKIMQMVALFDLYQRDYRLQDCKQLAEEAVTIADKNKNKNLIGIANLLKGVNYKDQEEYEKAQTYLLIALKNINSQTNKKALGDANSYMGFIQEQMKEYKKAVNYHRAALQIRSTISEKATSNSLLRLATCFTNLKLYDSAYAYFYRGVAICKKYSMNRSLAGLYNNLGITFNDEKKHDSALAYYNKGLEVVMEMKDSVYIAGALINIGSVYVEQKNVTKAIEYYKRGLWIAKQIKYKEWIANGSSGLADLYYQRGEYKLAYENFMISRNYRDSLLNEAKANDIANAEEKYQSEKRQQELQIADLKIKMQGDELNKSNTQRTLLIVGLIISLIVFLLMFWGYRQMKKLTKELSIVNTEVVKKNSIIEEKNKDITDSIHYAKQIQKALLGSDKLFTESFKEHFILFKPKDIVSGDYYWAYRDEKEILIANADCTGHGVPGAFMSLIGVSKLNEIIKEKNIRETDRVMHLLREGILDIFSAANQKQQSKDGMDMVMMRYNFKARKLQFSCANNGLWVLRAGEIIRYKADKFPVGFSYGSIQPFTLNEIVLNEGDIVLTFSDGYADQFGGPRGKKFKYKNMENIIKDAAQQPLPQMKKTLEKALVDWQGGLEQVDDICVIGFKV